MNFSLKTAPRGEAEVQILDNDGKRRARAARDGARRAKPHRLGSSLRSAAADCDADDAAQNPHIWEEPRFRGQDTRPVTHWGLEPAQVGPIVTPGKYTVKLTVDGQSSTQPIEVLRDPKVATSVADIDLSVSCSCACATTSAPPPTW